MGGQDRERETDQPEPQGGDLSRRDLVRVLGGAAGIALAPGLSLGCGGYEGPPAPDTTSLRGRIPILGERAYFGAGGVAPAHLPGIEAVQALLDSWSQNALTTLFDDGALLEEEVAALFGRVVGAPSTNIALTQSVTDGLNLAYELIAARPEGVPPGSNVVVDGYAYPSQVHPLMAGPYADAELRIVNIPEGFGLGHVPLDDMAAAIDDNTVVVSISQVSFYSGHRMDVQAVAEMARAHNAILVVDGAHSGGRLDVDVIAMDADFYAGNARKWCMGAPGVGFLYIADRQLSLPGAHPGYRSGDGDQRNPRPFMDARKHRGGQPNHLGYAYTKAGLELLLESGSIAEVVRMAEEVQTYMLEAFVERGFETISPIEASGRGGINLVDPGGLDPLEVETRLAKAGVDIRLNPLSNYGGEVLRIDVHFFNSREDVDRLMSVIDELA